MTLKAWQELCELEAPPPDLAPPPVDEFEMAHVDPVVVPPKDPTEIGAALACCACCRPAIDLVPGFFIAPPRLKMAEADDAAATSGTCNTWDL